jgi:hypothetical protein
MGPKQRRLDYKEVGVDGDSSPNLDYTNSGASLHMTLHTSKIFGRTCFAVTIWIMELRIKIFILHRFEGCVRLRHRNGK